MSEFNRLVRVDTIGLEPREIAIETSPNERSQLAKRFDIAALEMLKASASVAVRSGEIHAAGTLQAQLVQLCVATNAELPATLVVPFAVIFRSDAPRDAPDAGIELSEGECDVVFFEGGSIDLGEAVAETLALAIDPYPRAADADAVLKQTGILSESEAGPFAALAALRK